MAQNFFPFFFFFSFAFINKAQHSFSFIHIEKKVKYLIYEIYQIYTYKIQQW